MFLLLLGCWSFENRNTCILNSFFQYGRWLLDVSNSGTHGESSGAVEVLPGWKCCFCLSIDRVSASLCTALTAHVPGLWQTFAVWDSAAKLAWICYNCTEDLLLVFWDRVSMYSPGCPGTRPIEQTDLKLRDLPASASSAGIKGVDHYCLATEDFFKKIYFYFHFHRNVFVIWQYIVCGSWWRPERGHQISWRWS